MTRRPGIVVMVLGMGVGSAAVAGPEIAWRARFEAPRVDHRCAIGADRTVYVQDSRGTVHAITPAGSVLWRYEAGGEAEGPVVVGEDGVIYAAANPAGPDVQVHAIGPEGVRRWVFTDTSTQGVLAGPAVGPDGRVYVVTEAIMGYGGRGIIALNGDGTVAWSRAGEPSIVEDDGKGAEIVFSPAREGETGGQLYFGVDGSRRLYGFTLDGDQRFAAVIGNNDLYAQFQPAVGVNGDVYLPSFMGGPEGLRLRAYAASDGSVRWIYPDESVVSASEVDTGPDGTVYVSFLHMVDAIREDGSRRWRHDEAGLYFGPVMGPLNDVIVVGGAVSFGEAGYFKGLDIEGRTLWRIDLEAEGGVQQAPGSRARFTPDGGRVYISADLPGLPDSEAYCYLYALDLAGPCGADVNGDGLVDFGDYLEFMNLYEARDPEADLTGDGLVDFPDYLEFLNRYEDGC